MCCFSQTVEVVSDTKIFARRSPHEGHQFLVYSMAVKAAEDLAMILPIPVPANSAEDAVSFISLQEYPDFFEDMRKGFPVEPSRSKSLGGSVDSKESLKVVEVGSFEASFVPSTAHFSRLDRRFRLPDGTWDQLPIYADYGFAVFKLKSGEKTIHPMAFGFPTALQSRLFFPTVHIHDGQVHDKADFDHALYCQLDGVDARSVRDWSESPQPAGMFLDTDKTGDLVDGDGHVYRRIMKGNLRNADVLV